MAYHGPERTPERPGGGPVMSAGRGKAIALLCVAAGGVVIIVCVASAWGTLCEEWYLRQLDSQEPAVRRAAAMKLAEIGSLRSLPLFLELLSRQEPAETMLAAEVLQKIIDRRGRAAEPHLAAFLERRD